MLLLKKLWCSAVIENCLSRKVNPNVVVTRAALACKYMADNNLMARLSAYSREKKAACFLQLCIALDGFLPEVILALFLDSFKLYGSLGLVDSVLAELKFKYGNIALQIRSASPMPKEVLKRIKQVIESRCGRKTEAGLLLDKKLLRGVVLHWDSYKWDMSLYGELEKIEKAFEL
jgi:F0F1-type ATP synthase delta subunit